MTLNMITALSGQTLDQWGRGSPIVSLIRWERVVGPAIRQARGHCPETSWTNWSLGPYKGQPEE